MKHKSTLCSFLLAGSTLVAVSFTHAASLYWDTDGAIAGAGGATPSGSWSTSGTTWSTSSNGIAAASPITTATSDDLFFSAGINATGSYTIGLSSSQDAKSLTFQDGAATISGAAGIINLGGTGIINVTNSLTASPNTATIGDNTSTLIAGSAGLTKVGVGTLTLSGTDVNTFTGGLNVNGGTLALNFSNLATPTDLINSGNALAFGGGNLSITGNPAGITNQTLGNLTVNSGGGSLLVNPNGGTDTNITLGSLTTSASGGSFVVGRATGSGAGNLNITTTTDKDATGIYGGRVVFADGTANTGYDWATNTGGAGPAYTLGAYVGYAALDTATVGNITDTNNSRITAAATLPAASNRTTNSLKFENPAASQSFSIGAGNTLTLTSGGLMMTGSNNAMKITLGSITAGDGTAPADLVLHQFNPAQPLAVGLTGGTLGNTPEISSSIANNNSQPVTLVKNGPGSIRFTGTNTFTGGVIVNQGSVDFGTNALNNNAMTFNANSFLYTNGAHVTSGSITLNNNSQVTVCNNNNSFTVNANVLGSGGIGAANGGQGAITLNLNGTGNTFTGPVRFMANNGTQQATISVASLPDTDALGTGNITFGAGTASSVSHNFGLASTAVAPLTLNNRCFEMAGTNVNQQINNASNQDLTINTDLIVSGSRGKNLQFGGAGTGISTFAGVIGNHPNPTAPGTIPLAVRVSSNGNTLTLASVEGITVGSTITGSAILPAGVTITAINPLTRVVTLSTSYTASNGNSINVGTILTVANVINSVSVSKSGTGTWIISGNNTYTGPTNITAGVFKIQHANALGSTTNGTLVASGATLDLGGTTGINEPITLNGTGVGTNGALINSSGTPAGITNGVAGVAVPATGVGSGFSTVPVVTFNGGGGSGAAATATLGVTAGSFGIDSGTTTYSVAPTVTISGGGGTGATATATLSGNPGTVTGITITNAGTGFTTAPTIAFSGGTVDAAGTDPTGTGNATNFCVGGITMTAAGSGYTSAPTLNLDGNPVVATVNLPTITLATNSSIGGSGDLTIDAGIAESGGARTLTKVGANTLTLGGANTYTGATNINGGTLVMTGATQATSAITFSGGGVLGLTTGTTVNAASATVDFTGQTVTVTGSPTLASYTLLTVGTMAGGDTEPTLSPAIPGYELDVVGNQLLLISTGAPAGFAAWQSANGTGGGLSDDHDGDGVDNGTEFFIYGPVANSGFTALPGVVNTGGTLSVTWPKGAGYTGVYGTDFTVETSSTLADPWATESVGVNVTDSATEVKYTFPAPLGTKNFARLKVTGP